MQSKILTGNGRWETSRLILPEHREQVNAHEQRQREIDSGVPAPIIAATPAEMRIIHDYVILPMALVVAERNRGEIAQTKKPLTGLFASSTDVLIRLIHKDIAEVRRTLRQHQIVIYEEDKNDGIAKYRYKLRGYEHQFELSRQYVRDEIGNRIRLYIDAIFTT